MTEEMGFDCDFEEVFGFVYKAKFENNLTEHEFDHVFIGTSEKLPLPNPEEVESTRFATIKEIRSEMEQEPEKFTVWFRIAFDKVEEYFNAKLKK